MLKFIERAEIAKKTINKVKKWDGKIRKNSFDFRESHDKKNYIQVYKERLGQNLFGKPRETIVEKMVMIPPAGTSLASSSNVPAFFTDDNLNTARMEQELENTRKRVDLLESENAEATKLASDLQRELMASRATNVRLRQTNKTLQTEPAVPIEGDFVYRTNSSAENTFFLTRSGGDQLKIDLGTPTATFGSRRLRQITQGVLAGQTTIRTEVTHPQTGGQLRPQTDYDEYRVIRNPIPVPVDNGGNDRYLAIVEDTQILHHAEKAGLAKGALIGLFALPVGLILGYGLNHLNIPALGHIRSPAANGAESSNRIPPVTSATPTNQAGILSDKETAEVRQPNNDLNSIRQSARETSLEALPGYKTAIQKTVEKITPSEVNAAEEILKDWSKKESVVYAFLGQDPQLNGLSDFDAKLNALAWQYKRARDAAKRNREAKFNFSPWKSADELKDMAEFQKTSEFNSIKLALLMYSVPRTTAYNNADGTSHNPIIETKDANGDYKTFFQHFKEPGCNHDNPDCQGIDHLEKYYGLVVPQEVSGNPAEANGLGYYLFNPQTGERIPILPH